MAFSFTEPVTAMRTKDERVFKNLGARVAQREPGGPEITEAELESELKAVRAELREAGARRT